MKRLFILFLLFFIIFLFACSNMHTQEDIVEKYPDEKTIFDNKPLRILINSKKQNYGLDVIGQNMFPSNEFFDLLQAIGEECEERFGYPVEFISLPANSAKNDYLSAMQSGMEIDLVFPSKVYEHIGSDYDAFYFWNDEFIEFYKDLSPYLTYCPDVYGHMQQFDYVMDMVTKEGKIYALYAGVTSVSHTTLLVKKSTFQEHNIQNISNYDELFVFLESMSEQEENADKAMVTSAHYRLLLDYATVKAGFYPVQERSYPNIVCKIDDEYVRPYLLEDTNILEVFFEEFGRFFERSFFTLESNEELLYKEDGPEIILNMYPNIMFTLDRYPMENPWNTYTMLLLENETPIIKTTDSILPIPVPYTCTQPEKAVSFVNWLFSDEVAGDMLTFGTDQGAHPNYMFTNEGNIYYEKVATVYMFGNLIANFSDSLYPFGNKTLNRSKEYLNLTKRAVYPPLYKRLESYHSDHYKEYKTMDSGYFNSPVIKKRTEYIENTLKKLYEDPSSITVDEMKVALDEITDQDEVLKIYNDFVSKLLS